MKNLEIRDAIKKHNLKYWQIANELGMTDGNFSRLLRKELDDYYKQKIMNIIKNLKESEENGQ